MMKKAMVFLCAMLFTCGISLSAHATPLYVEQDLIGKSFAELERYIIDIPAASLTAPGYHDINLELVFDVIELNHDGWDDETQKSVDYLTILTVLDSGEISDVFNDMISYDGQPLQYSKSSSMFSWAQGDGDIRFEVFSDVSNPVTEFWTLSSATSSGTPVGSTTPEPGTMLLIGTGLVGLAGFKKEVQKLR